MKTLSISEKQVDLPDFMNMITPSMLKLIEMSPDFNERIISCGIDTRDNSLLLLTGGIEVRKISPNGYMKPIDAKPGKTGKTIELTFKGVDEEFSILSKVALKNSISCMTDASLFFRNNYICDVDLFTSESFSEDNEQDNSSKNIDKRRSGKND